MYRTLALVYRAVPVEYIKEYHAFLFEVVRGTEGVSHVQVKFIKSCSYVLSLNRRKLLNKVRILSLSIYSTYNLFIGPDFTEKERG